jgi:hypothetical protein
MTADARPVVAGCGPALASLGIGLADGGAGRIGPAWIGAQLGARQADERRIAAAAPDEADVRVERHRHIGARRGSLGVQRSVDVHVELLGQMADVAPDRHASGAEPAVVILDRDGGEEVGRLPEHAPHVTRYPGQSIRWSFGPVSVTSGNRPRESAAPASQSARVRRQLVSHRALVTDKKVDGFLTRCYP